MKYALFTGCMAQIREISYELSARRVLETLGATITDIEDFSCCAPTCLVDGFDYVAGLSMTARNLCLAEASKLPILTLCASCFETLSRTNYLLKEHQELKNEVNEVLSTIGKKFQGTVKVTHIVKTLYEDYGLKKLRRYVVKPLDALRVGTFYGCHLIRPSEIVNFDDPEAPTTLDELVEVLGAESVHYEYKKSCCIGCGAFFGGVSEEIALALNRKTMDGLKKANVDCVVTTCPFCFFQFDMGQLQIADKLGERYDIPVVYYTDLLGLALGLGPEELGITLHRIDTSPLLKKIGVKHE